MRLGGTYKIKPRLLRPEAMTAKLRNLNANLGRTMDYNDRIHYANQPSPGHAAWRFFKTALWISLAMVVAAKVVGWF